jgi:FolB domain-containing protein
MSEITICDLEVYYRVGVSDEERARPQRLLLTLTLSFDFSGAAHSDRIEETINYQEVVNGLLTFGDKRSWKLLEKLVGEIADWILTEYRPQAVRVEAKKFIIPQARHIAASCSKTLPPAP